MRLPALQTPASEFDQRNATLQLSLGCLAWGDRLRALLAAEGIEPRADAQSDCVDDPVYFVLGLLAFDQRVRNELSAAAQAQQPQRWQPGAAPPEPKAQLPRDLLR
ncbi:hypothetical protein OAX78_01795 [Planctomycetota bacterium]|nr:hypothetical protein [Planctomycetota bacterium]